MNIYESLIRQEHLTENEKKIAALILKSPEEFLGLPAKEYGPAEFSPRRALSHHGGILPVDGVLLLGQRHARQPLFLV